jgi:hypothetical protein
MLAAVEQPRERREIGPPGARLICGNGRLRRAGSRGEIDLGNARGSSARAPRWTTPALPVSGASERPSRGRADPRIGRFSIAPADDGHTLAYAKVKREPGPSARDTRTSSVSGYWRYA